MIELLVVIGIIVVLASLLLSSVSRVRSYARFTECKAAMRAILQAHLVYSQRYDDVKPPLWIMQATNSSYDLNSPDVRWSSQPVGQGLLVSTGILPGVNSLLDPSESLSEDREIDRKQWTANARSGSSYVYAWRYAPAVIDPATLPVQRYNQSRAARELALLLDLNTDGVSTYQGEYSGRAWASHPGVGRVNVGYIDGEVLDFPARLVQLKAPGSSLNEQDWVKAANAAHP